MNFNKQYSSEQIVSNPGFNYEKGTALINRNLSLVDLSTCMQYFGEAGETDFIKLKKAIIEDNLLGKETISNRRDIIEKLRLFYALDASFPIFSFFQTMWVRNPNSRPLLAFQLAQARDRFLYKLHFLIESFTAEQQIQTKTVLNLLPDTWKSSYSENSINAMAKHLVSAWSEAGFLLKGSKKYRVMPEVFPENICYAIFLCKMQEISGEQIFNSVWLRSLLLDRQAIINLGIIANQKGIIEFQMSSNLLRIKFPELAGTGIT
jgi:hypothetical protein